MLRKSVVAGQFYPGTPDQLRAMIKSMVDENAVKEEIVGLISPHAGYVYSGPVAGAVISRIKFKDTFIIIGPNHTGNGKPFSIMTEGVWETPLGEVEIDSELAKRVLASSNYLEEDYRAHQYEHSIEAQLPFLQYFKPDVKIVPIVLGSANGGICKEIGKEIVKAIKESDKEPIIMVSSDMTHYESQEDTERKDNQAIEAILDLNEDELLKRVSGSGISMCGYAPAVCLITAAKELGANEAELVKYQTSGDVTGDYSSVVGYTGIILRKALLSLPVRLARETVETYIREGRIPEVKNLPSEMKGRAGVFVSIHRQGELRGCIGTFEPVEKDVAEEIISNAISSATRDPRFPPITSDELEDLDYSVDILTRPEPVEEHSQLDPKKYGVIVESGFRRGLLLPDLEGVDSTEQQISICRMKAGITPDESVKLYRFEVKRYKERPGES